MNIFPLLILLFLSIESYSQVGINTVTPDDSSILDISSSNKGLLIPRVRLMGTTNRFPITNPAESLLVYNLTTTADVTPGFYYWTGSAWKSLLPSTTIGGGGSNSWNLNGNNVGNNDFLGTTGGYQALKFKVSGNDFGQFHPGGGISLGFGSSGTANRSISFGDGSSAGQDAVAIGTSAKATNNESVAIGYGSRSIFRNVAIGLNATSAGNDAVVIGSSAVGNNQNTVVIGKGASGSGNDAIVIGTGSASTNQNTIAMGNLARATADQTIAMGSGASSNGYQAIAIGNNARGNNQNSVAIGNNSLSTLDNQIVLGGTSNTQVRTFGNLVVGGTNPYTLPNVRGNANQILKTNGAGIVSWQDDAITASNVAYGEIYKTAATVGINNSNPIPFEQSGPRKNLGTNGQTFIETGTIQGVYRITYTLSVDPKNNDVEFFLTKGLGSNNKIPGSSVYVSLNGNSSKTTLTKSMLVTVNTANQRFYVYSDISNNNFSILPGSSLAIELID